MTDTDMADRRDATNPSPPNGGEGALDTEAEAVVEETLVTPDDPALEDRAGHLGLSLPDDPAEANELLVRELEESRQEAGELMGNLQRIAAEFDNYRKRTERDQVENVQRASQRVIQSLLPTLDSFDAALALEATTDAETKMLAGMKGTHALLLEALEAEGFEPIAATGQPFDPAVHEAVSVLPGEGDQIVTEELRKGYVMRGRVIRPSLVIVGHA